ncbi:MMPL family transporter [Corynebacterium casei]|uniref:RND superfamily drug exporter n=1 Tax=Corynebacterium casei LMG S-19264 TaxID=1285583 RepID=A0ABN4CDX2_9CORY|nr:MMPL family transporter [Corynebacterium casei]AHI20524.1 RND superfamily drug exporter [Corynebacterium casei LMG S-19264]
MSKVLYRLGRWSYTKVWPFIAFWIILLVAMGGLAAQFAKPANPSFAMPPMDSTTTQEEMAERFGDDSDYMSDPSGTIVIEAPEGTTLTEPEVMAEVDTFVEDLKATGVLADQDAIVNPVMASMGMQQQMGEQMAAQGMPQEQIDANIQALSPLSEDERTGTISVAFDAEGVTDIAPEDREAITSLVNEFDEGDFTAKYSGNAFSTMSEGLDMSAEVIGLIVAGIVLLITFGSMVAAGMPLISAVIGVGVGLLGVQLSTIFTDSVAEMTPMLASMIGLAVGIDYALFIVARFRNQLITSSGLNDLSPKEFAAELKKMDKETRAHAMGMATGTAGSSVVFAGITVVIALAALTIIGIPFLSTMAIAAAATVTIAVLVALTFIPGLLGLLGTKIFAGRVPGPKVPDPEDEKPTVGLKWVRQIRKHPVVSLVAGILILGIAAIPAAQMRLAMPTDGMSAQGTPQRESYDMIDEAFGPGRNAPMVAFVDVADVAEQERMPAIQDILTDFQATEGVVNAQIIATTDNMDAAQVMITPTTGATDEETTQTLEALRSHQAEFTDTAGGTYGITGITPIFDDISERLSDVLVPYIAIVLVLAFIVLLLVFRSIWVPLIAAGGFALSMAAAFGVTVGIFQEGMFGIITDTQPLLSFLPIMLIGLTFGLAMDYQVFLVTRMREGYVHGKTAANATSNGFKHGARVVTAAAIIMISVFAAFMLIDEPFIRTMGFALAVGVAFDAFIVRMLIIPATMFLLGDKAWWIPKWLDKILPNMDIEGTALTDHEAELRKAQSSADAETADSESVKV